MTQHAFRPGHGTQQQSPLSIQFHFSLLSVCCTARFCQLQIHSTPEMVHTARPMVLLQNLIFPMVLVAEHWRIVDALHRVYSLVLGGKSLSALAGTKHI